MEDLKQKIGLYKLLSRIERECKNSGRDLFLMMQQEDTGSLMIPLHRFKVVIDTVDPTVTHVEHRLLCQQYEIHQGMNSLMEFKEMSKDMSRLKKVRDLSTELALKINSYINSKDMDIDTFLANADAGKLGWVSISILEKIMRTVDFEVEESNKNLMFISMNDFDDDTKIEFKQIIDRIEAVTGQKLKKKVSATAVVPAMDKAKILQAKELLWLINVELRKDMLPSFSEFLKQRHQNYIQKNDRLLGQDFKKLVRRLVPGTDSLQLEHVLTNLKDSNNEVPIASVDEALLFINEQKVVSKCKLGVTKRSRDSRS
jgi:hypothetical protein